MKSLRPTPAITSISRPFFDAARAGVLILQTCRTCGGSWYPARTNCPACLGDELEWKPASGRGRLWSWIIMHQPYLKSFKDEVPYLVAFVQLDEGPTMIAGLVDLDATDLVIDLPLEVTFESLGADDVPMPFFRAAT